MAASAPDSEALRSEGVRERLRRAADRTGFVRFDRFMEIALYADDVGYYSAPRPPLGPAGDFYTAPHVSPLFAESIAGRIRSARTAFGSSGPFRVVELGPGDGALAAGIARALNPEPDGLEIVLVDRSPARAAEALEVTRRASGRIPSRTAGALSDDGPFAGVVLANEFLDAQPARRLRWTGASWNELGVRVEGGRLTPAESEGIAPVPAPPLPRPAEAGTILEFSPQGEATMREVADHLSAGVALFLDYGMEESELLAGHPSGTLAAVRGHRTPADPLAAPGATDLSTFVNFSRVRAAAAASGLRELSYRSQAEALGAWGFPERLAAAISATRSPEDAVRLRLAAKNLLFGFERFRVLELGAGPATAT